MFDIRKATAAFAFGAVALGLAGCANTEQVSSLESRVAVIEQQQAATNTRIDQLDATTNQTMTAAQEAKQAAQDAAETSRRIEDMFKKTMQK